jgi:hypothetical protein
VPSTKPWHGSVALALSRFIGRTMICNHAD